MPADPHPSGDPVPFVLVRRLLNPETVGWMCGLATAAYVRLDDLRPANAPFTTEIEVPPRGRFVVTASSFSLDAVLGDGDIARLLEGIGVGPVRSMAARNLGDRLALDLDRSWVRRQFPPGQAPRFHAPHGWHQDGALGHDFSAAGNPGVAQERLLEMVTCWFALAPCGQHVPGLELIDDHVEELQSVDSLKDQNLRDSFSETSFERPTLEAGDALLFPGGTLHRTHVTAEMRQDRTSLELRFFAWDRLPQRLQGNHFVPLRQ